MDYFEAVQQGRGRVQDAINLLQEVVGQCYPMLFLKIGPSEWTPVGTETLYSVVPGKTDTAAVVACDSDGNSKAMSTWVPKAKADEFANALAARGIAKFEGEVKLPI